MKNKTSNGKGTAIKTAPTKGARITDAMPTNKPFKPGDHVTLGIYKAGRHHLGTGVIHQLSDYTFIVSGNYDFDLGFGAFKGKGTWSINQDSNDGGRTYTSIIRFTGTSNIDNTITATAKESTLHNKTIITYSENGQPPVVQSYQNSGTFQTAKVFYSTTIDEDEWKIYLYKD